jgi:hypothetical protein
MPSAEPGRQRVADKGFSVIAETCLIRPAGGWIDHPGDLGHVNRWKAVHIRVLVKDGCAICKAYAEPLACR